MIVREAMELITSVPSDVGAHLASLLALGILYGLARSSNSRSAYSASETWWSISEILILLQLLYFLGAGLAGIGLLDGRVLLPVFNRFISLAALLLWIHGFGSLWSDAVRSRWVGLLLALTLLGSLAAIFLLSPPNWADRLNRSLYDAGWGALGLALAAGSAISLGIRRPNGWSVLAAGYTLLAVGFTLHLGLGPAESSQAPFVRWGELLALPFLVMSAVRSFQVETAITVPVEKNHLQAEYPPDEELFFLPQVFANLAAVMQADNPHDLARAAVEGIGRSMKAELTLLLTPPEESGYLSLATGFDLISERHIEGQALESADLPVITHALNHGHALILPDSSKAKDLITLRRAIGINHTGPVLLASMTHDGDVLGGILLFSPYARQRWSQSSRRVLIRLSSLVAEQLAAVQQPAPEGEIESMGLSSDLLHTRMLVQRLIDENAKLTEQLIHATDQAGHELAEFLTDHQLAEETIVLLESEVERMRRAVRDEPVAPTQTEQVEQLSFELQQALQELASARARMAMMEYNGEAQGSAPMGPADIELIANLARDLRQPMSSVLGYAELLLDESVGLLNRKQREFLEHVRNSTERMALLLSNLVNLAAIKTGTLNLVPTSIDVLFPIEDAVNQVSPALQRKEINLRVNLGKALPRILGDPDATHQVLVHLLNNALGAANEGGEVQIGARIAGEDQAGFLSLWVHDNGPRIPPDAIPKVFDPHYPATGNIPGIGDDGIGLSIARSLTEAMGGRIWVENPPEGGVKFTLLLPLAEQPVGGSPENTS
jgi:signal transduction histidine kinase